MKLKNRLAFEGDSVLEQLEKTKNVALAWCVRRNRANLEKPLEDVRKMVESTPEMKALNEAVQKTVEEFAEKDESGRPKFEQSGDRTMVRIADSVGYTEAINKLHGLPEHAKAIADAKEIQERELVLLEEEIDWEPFKIKIDRIKDGDMDGAQMKILDKMGIIDE